MPSAMPRMSLHAILSEMFGQIVTIMLSLTASFVLTFLAFAWDVGSLGQALVVVFDLVLVACTVHFIMVQIKSKKLERRKTELEILKLKQEMRDGLKADEET